MLHGNDAFRPATLQKLQILQKLVCVGCDAQKPLGEVLLLNGRVAAPAAAFHDLFVGKHGVAGRTPVLGGSLSVEQALFQEFDKEELFPAVVFGTAGGELSCPVVAVAKALHLAAHVGNVGIGPAGRVGIVLDGSVFGRQAEGVPADGVQDVEALHSLGPGQNIAYAVVAHMPHVQIARGIGEHFEHIVFGQAALVGTGKGMGFFPALLPFQFDFLGIVSFHVFFFGGTGLFAPANKDF